MRYFSTRNSDNIYGHSFKYILFSSLSENAGLFVPEMIPSIIINKNMDFFDIAFSVFRAYINPEEIPNSDLYDLLKSSFQNYRHPEITPLVKLQNSNINVLELFWGPTYSFKDIALGVIGNLFEYFLEKNGVNINGRNKIDVICATSGDTGGAAIHSLRGKRGINCCVLHPHEKISDVQKHQMVTVLDSNITNLAVRGTFDDCQRIVKRLLYNFDYVSVNSINWARILTQMVYYFYSYNIYLKRTDSEWGIKIDYSVPTGNFGDILAGYYAKMMGLPIDKLIIATNKNDTLYRFLQTGKYDPKPTQQTSSPAMDISIPSNFERLLYHVTLNSSGSREDACALVNFQMRQRDFLVSKRVLESIKMDFVCKTITEEETNKIIKYIYDQDNYVIDPHTAVGIGAYYKYKYNNYNYTNYNLYTLNDLGDILKNMNINSAEHYSTTTNIICLATAHPGKFSDTVSRVIGNCDFIPKEFEELKHHQQRYTVIDNSVEEVLLYM